MKFGDYLRQIREKHGWTQPEAAARADIEQSYLSKVETGKSYPSEDVFNRLTSVYNLDIKDMSRSIFSEELDKLREVAQVRAIILSRQQNETYFIRSWLVIGLILLMAGAGLTSSQFFEQKGTGPQFIYKSEGLILSGEPITLFDFMQDGKTAPTKTEASKLLPVSERLDYEFMTIKEFRGESFVWQVEGGQRFYKFVSSTPPEISNRNLFLFAFGIMLMTGGLASFFISSRWR
ncbi:MAG: helix-turn-helix domain-containing protein [Kordiimonas sp.]